MKIKVDFGKELIELGHEKINYFQHYSGNLSFFLEQYSRIVFNLRKYFTIDGFDYADLFSYMIYQDDRLFRDEPGMVIIFNYLEMLDSLHVSGAEKIDLEVDDFFPGILKGCLELVAKKKGFKTGNVTEQNSGASPSLVYNNHFLVRQMIKSRIIMRYIIGGVRRLLFRHDKSRADVLFLGTVTFANADPKKSLIFGPVISELDRRKFSSKVVMFEPIYELEKMGKFLKDFMFRKNAYIGDYWSCGHMSQCRKDFKLLRKRWNELKDNEDFKSIFIYKGYNFYELIKPRLELVFSSLSYIVCDNKEITGNIIRKEDFKVLCLEHEEGMYGKGFMLNLKGSSGKVKGRKVAALSHEIISDGTIHTYFRSPESLNKRSGSWRPLPDIKFVWGDYAKKELVKSCNYPESIIKATGFPKFDFIFNTRYDRQETWEKLGLDGRRKKILLSEQTNLDFSLTKEYLDMARQNPNMDFVIKPHPSEDMDEVRRRFSRKTANMHIVDKYADIYGLVHASDYVVVKISTVGFEAMLMGKTVFVLNPRKDRLIGLPYVRSGAAIEISSARDFSREMARLGQGSGRSDQLRKMKAFVGGIHHGNDGRAATRVADELEKLLRRMGRPESPRNPN